MNQFFSRGRTMVLFLTLISFLFFGGGCALFHREKSDPANDALESAFESERSEQSKMSDFAASAGRKNPKEKRDVSKGETFLLSDKAKEIYANTER